MAVDTELLRKRADELSAGNLSADAAANMMRLAAGEIEYKRSEIAAYAEEAEDQRRRADMIAMLSIEVRFAVTEALSEAFGFPVHMNEAQEIQMAIEAARLWRQVKKDIEPLHDLIHSNPDWTVEAWGENVCQWAADKIRELTENENE